MKTMDGIIPPKLTVEEQKLYNMIKLLKFTEKKCPTISDLSKKIGKSRQSVSKLVQRLSDKGFVNKKFKTEIRKKTYEIEYPANILRIIPLK